MKKNILIVTPYFFPEGGGLENYAFKLGEELRRLGNEVNALCLTRRKSSEETVEGIRVLRKKAHWVVGNTPIRFSFYGEMLALVRNRNIDLIHAHTPVPFAVDVAALVSRRMGIPLVITYHSNTLYRDQWWMDTLTTLYLPFQALAFRRASVIAAVSQGLRQTYPSYASKMTVIPSGVNLGEFPQTSYPKQSQRCLFIGPLSSAYPSKGLDVLLKSMVRVHQKFPMAELWVAGGGNRQEAFEIMAKKLGIAPRVRFFGQVDHSKIPSMMREANVIVVPSLKSEGAPTVIVEAMASGRPVIGTNVGGIPDLIQHGQTGAVVAPHDDGQLAKFIIEYLSNPELAARLGSQGRKQAEQHYAWSTVGKRYEEIFESCLA